MYGVFNHGLRSLPGLENFLGGPVARCFWRAPADLTATVGWGRRSYAKRARTVAAARSIPFLCLEDGFLRSVSLGQDDPPLSLVIDDLGIYYDATVPSRLEQYINRAITEQERQRAQQLKQQWQAGRVSKYNHAREITDLPQSFVLVVDQTRDDASIRYGLADKTSFSRMLEAALDQYPKATVLLKAHPEVLAGRKRGHFDQLTPGQAARVRVLQQDVHPAGLLQRADAVYAVTSQMGFEGLLWGKPVHCFGMPFYAGWGLTHDHLPAPVRRKPMAIENLVHATLIDYPRYMDPETGARCSVERVVDWMSLQRRMRERFPAHMMAWRFSPWKKPIVRRFFQGSQLHFVNKVEQIPEHASLIVWGQRLPMDHLPKQVAQLQLEDGFLRSVGLGADLVQPLSWVVDRCGMYYDATQPSELENLLQTTKFDEHVIARACALRQRIVAEGLTKYNVGRSAWQRRDLARRVILVPGQVESDASIALGAPKIRNNLALLQAVRQAHPDAYLVYKPHPDVQAGLRSQGIHEHEAHRYCDEVVTEAAMANLLDTVDEVHVLTSLTGFEALLRGKKVVCYGQPFYAGWGLTHDQTPLSRRTRHVSLDELVAGALILYPTYMSRHTGRFTTPERALDELLTWRTRASQRLPLWRHCWRWLIKTSARV